MAGSSHPGIVRSVFFPEFGIVFYGVEALFELRQAIHERLGDILATEFTKSLRYYTVEGGELSDQRGIVLFGDDAIQGDGVAVWLLG